MHFCFAQSRGFGRAVVALYGGDFFDVFLVRRKGLTLTAKAWMRLGWQERNRDKFSSLCSLEFVNHSASGSSLTAFLDGIFELYRGFPDFYAKFGSQVVDVRTRKVATLWTGIGTHYGDMPRFPATGRTLIFHGIEIIRIQADKVVERWGESDAVYVMARSAGVQLASRTIVEPQRTGRELRAFDLENGDPRLLFNS